MRSLIPFLSAVVLGISSIFGAEPTREISPKVAVRLISVKSLVPENAIEIPFIVDGRAKCGPDFEVTEVRRVAAIHAVRENGRESRRLTFYDLFWNESLGWFMWESRNERGGDAVYIWSETRGIIVNR